MHTQTAPQLQSHDNIGYASTSGRCWQLTDTTIPNRSTCRCTHSTIGMLCFYQAKAHQWSRWQDQMCLLPPALQWVASTNTTCVCNLALPYNTPNTSARRGLASCRPCAQKRPPPLAGPVIVPLPDSIITEHSTRCFGHRPCSHDDANSCNFHDHNAEWGLTVACSASAMPGAKPQGVWCIMCHAHYELPPMPYTLYCLSHHSVQESCIIPRRYSYIIAACNSRKLWEVPIRRGVAQVTSTSTHLTFVS